MRIVKLQLHEPDGGKGRREGLTCGLLGLDGSAATEKIAVGRAGLVVGHRALPTNGESPHEEGGRESD